jgi:predicted MarR family transcription regulator
MRKLARSGLIEAKGGSSRKETRYRATAAGRSVTGAYAALRTATLPPMLDALDGRATKSKATSIHLDLISSLYAQAERAAMDGA